MTLLSNMPHTCTASRTTRTADGYGGFTESFTETFSGRACWRQRISERAASLWQARSIAVTNKVYFASDPGLIENDVLTFPDDSGWRYVVMAASEPDASAGLSLLWSVVVDRERED